MLLLPAGPAHRPDVVPRASRHSVLSLPIHFEDSSWHSPVRSRWRLLQQRQPLPALLLVRAVPSVPLALRHALGPGPQQWESALPCCKRLRGPLGLQGFWCLWLP